jgi:hypothetical protein
MVAIKQLLMVNHEIETPEGGGLSLSNPTSVGSSRSFTTFDTGKYFSTYICMYMYMCIHVCIIES